MGLQRQWDRHGGYLKSHGIIMKHTHLEEGQEAPPKTIDKWNEELSSRPEPFACILHPRKGFRPLSLKRGRAAMVVAEQKQRLTPPTILVLAQIKMFVTTGRYK